MAGDIPDHHREATHKAIAKLIEGEAYYTGGVKIVQDAIKKGWAEAEISAIVAAALGNSPRRWRQRGPAYIDPDKTMRGLERMLAALDRTLARRQKIILATAHPGSLLSFYIGIARYVQARGGKLFALGKPVVYWPHRWVDAVDGVLVASDCGNLIHTHDTLPMEAVLRQAGRIGLVIADHGFAGAAINAGITTVALCDVDDPSFPLAEHLRADVIPVPSNDNRLNIKTEQVWRAFLAARGDGPAA
jgi:hypothetical protein